jgi:hypothetical protein
MTKQETPTSSGLPGKALPRVGGPPRALWTIAEYCREIGCSIDELRRQVESRGIADVSVAFDAQGERHG